MLDCLLIGAAVVGFGLVCALLEWCQRQLESEE